MLKKLIVFLIIIFLVLTSSPNIFGSKTNNLNEIIVPDDYSSIQAAVDNANDDDTIFVRSGIYYENLIVDKSLALRGENKDTTIIDGRKNSHVIRVMSSNVSISNFTIRNSSTDGFYQAGVIFNNVSNVNISRNIISDNMRGVNGIRSKKIIIHNNIFINDGIIFDGWNMSNYDHDIKGNTVNGKPLYYYKYKNDFTVPSDAGQVILFNCYNVVLNDLNINNTDCGILVYCSEGCVIQNSRLSNIDVYGIMIDTCSALKVKNNNISSGMFGLVLASSLSCIIEDNTIKGNAWVGISLYFGCLWNLISGNNIDLNSSSRIFDFPSTGIWIRYYCNSNIFEDNIVSNCQIGLWMESSDENIIKSNLFDDCHIVTSQQLEKDINFSELSINIKDILPMTITKGVGLLLLDTSANEINLNTVTDNDIGVVIIRSWFDSISFNNIMDSTTGIDFITFFSFGYYPLNYWGSSLTGPVFKCNKFFCLVPWSPIRFSDAP
jgi:parallel beta-helix repeat protein